MSTTPFATATDVAARWRPLSTAETAIADTLAADASDMIRNRWPDIDLRVAGDNPTALSVTRIVAAMVKRAMLVGDAEGLSQHMEVAGPFQQRQTFANPNGNLYFTSEDIRVLSGETARAKMGWLA